MTRWTEELALVELEMDNTMRSFNDLEATWKRRQDSTQGAGYKAYACRKAALWEGMYTHVSNVFSKARLAHQPVVAETAET